MLNNTNWDLPKQQPKYDVHSIESLIGWLQTKNPDEGYNYCSMSDCINAQYYRAMGYRMIVMRNQHFTHGWLRRQVDLPLGFYYIAMRAPWTFGAALRRAPAWLPKPNNVFTLIQTVSA